MSQQALAEVVHVTQQSIHKYEHELAEPDLDVILHLADFFDTSVDYLLGYTDVMERYEISPENAISGSELRVLEYYRQLSPRAKELIRELAKEGRGISS